KRGSSSRRRRRYAGGRWRAHDAASATVPIPTAASCARAPVSSRATTHRSRSASRTSCSPAPSRGLPASGPVAKMERRLARAPNKRRYRRRQALVEPVIAHLKHLRRLDRLLLRGLGGAELEWTLA